MPTAGKVYWDGVLSGGAGAITWDSAQRPPLLLIAGGLDKIAEVAMTKKIYAKQKRARSVDELKVYPAARTTRVRSRVGSDPDGHPHAARVYLFRIS